MSIKPIVSFLTPFVYPKSDSEDIARREFILNILLIGAVALLLTATAIDIATLFVNVASGENALPSIVIYGLLLFFLFLYILSRKRYVALASYLLLGAFFLLTAYMGYHWGVDVPAQIVFYPLVIVMAGILISTRVAFFATILIAITMALTGYLQYTHVIEVNAYWKNELWTWSDITMIIIIYFIVATVTWLSNREIEKSLRRARKSEAQLKEERDTLEIRVEERTRELRQTEMEKMSQAYRFVEFGRLAGGIFHDLVNPLAALSLNIDRIADTSGRSALSQDVARAKRAAAHMQELMESMRKHLSREGSTELFAVKEVLRETCQMLTSYAKARRVRILVCAAVPSHIYGDPVAFAQVMTNLVSNAIHAYESGAKDGARDVSMELDSTNEGVYVRVRDEGSGIAPENLPLIFEPFFTTSASKGIGIGLSLAKRIVEKGFGGTLSVDSEVGKGSTFTVYLPIREP